MLPHVGLILLSCLYTLLGGTMFYVIERPHEIEAKSRSVQNIRNVRDNISLWLWDLQHSNLTRQDYLRMSQDQMDRLILAIVEDRQKEFLTRYDFEEEIRNRWTFSAAVFFSATVITTIGGFPTCTNLPPPPTDVRPKPPTPPHTIGVLFSISSIKHIGYSGLIMSNIYLTAVGSWFLGRYLLSVIFPLI